jgi:hypothetical protein
MATIYWIVKPGYDNQVRISSWLNANCNHWFGGKIPWPIDPNSKRDRGYVECYWFDDWQDPTMHTIFKLMHSDVILEYRLEKPHDIS